MFCAADFAWVLIDECRTLDHMYAVVRHIESLRLRAQAQERWPDERRLYTAGVYARGWCVGGLTSRQ